ncbi:hypothetical protein HMPREF9374_2738 [Desmospora sp. 8437]|nr:hypothetical protein HMPREF9374_2738 [Desmospora sp. 8437]
MVICPFCDGNGIIMKAKISRLDLDILICNECEAMWKLEDILKEDTFEQFTVWMRNQGMKGLWSELSDIKNL